VLARIAGKTFAFAPNPSGMVSLRLDALGPDLSQECTVRREPTGLLQTRGPIGMDGSFRTNERAAGPAVAARGHWLDDGRLRIETRLLREGVVVSYALSFAEDAVHVSFESNFGASTSFSGTMV